MKSISTRGQGIGQVIQSTRNALAIVGAIMLFVMMIIGAADVIGRYIFNSPITGTLEVSKIMMMGVVVLSWANTQALRGHVAVDFITNRLPRRIQAKLKFGADLISLVLFGLIAWQAVLIGIQSWQEHSIIPTIHVSIAYMYLIIFFGSCVMCLTLITQLTSAIYSDKRVKANT